jgi:hypothetical protein
LRDIVTGDEVSSGVRHDPIPEVPSGFLEPTEGGDANDPVDVNTADLLECAHCRVDVVIEDVAITTANAEKSEALKAVSDFGDCRIPNPAHQVKGGEFGRCLHNHGD